MGAGSNGKNKVIEDEIKRIEIIKMNETQNDFDYERENYQNKFNLIKEEFEKILSQMTHSLCKILNNNKGCGTGFFCLLPLSEKKPALKTLITNNHVLDIEDISPDKTIKITINNCVISRRIEIGGKRKLYTNQDYDITIIEIIDSDNLDFIKYLEIDEKVFCDLKENEKKFEKVYLIHYPGQITKVGSTSGSMEIDEINKNINHTCETEKGSSGSPIFDLSTFKIMGIHKGKISILKKTGTFLKLPIEEFKEFNKRGILDNYATLKSHQKQKITKPEEKQNIIKLILKVNKKDIGKEVYFLGDSEENKNKTELNKTNTKIYIDNDELKDFQKYFKPENEKDYSIKLIFDIQIKDCSYMFFKCANITKIDLSSFDTRLVTNMNHMFGRCYNLTDIDLNNITTDKVTDMGYLFSKCKNLMHVDLSSFETKNVKTMCCMFHENFSLTQIYLNFFDTKNVTDMSCMFCKCYKLEKLDLKSFNTKKVVDMSHMFDECIELKEIVTTSQFYNTEKVQFLCHMFRNCNNLTKMEFNFDVKNANYLSYMFSGCNNLTNINLSNFKTKNVKDMTYMFSGCNNLSSLDLSTFTFDKVLKMNNMFDECTNLKTIKVNKNWKEKMESENGDYKTIITF